MLVQRSTPTPAKLAGGSRPALAPDTIASLAGAAARVVARSTSTAATRRKPGATVSSAAAARAAGLALAPAEGVGLPVALRGPRARRGAGRRRPRPRVVARGPGVRGGIGTGEA